MNRDFNQFEVPRQVNRTENDAGNIPIVVRDGIKLTHTSMFNFNIALKVPLTFNIEGRLFYKRSSGSHNSANFATETF